MICLHFSGNLPITLLFVLEKKVKSLQIRQIEYFLFAMYCFNAIFPIKDVIYFFEDILNG